MIEKEQKNYLLEKVKAYCQKWNAFEADIFEQQGKEEAELRKKFRVWIFIMPKERIGLKILLA